VGAVKSVERADGATLAMFENGWAVENDSGEVTPLIGKIGETWANDGGLDNEIGLPTAPETRRRAGLSSSRTARFRGCKRTKVTGTLTSIVASNQNLSNLPPCLPWRGFVMSISLRA
jgi:hypothetical protein